MRLQLMFEEGEEGYGNGQNLCLYLQKHKLHADICYASHVRWDVPAGKVACNRGTAMSGLYHFELELFGQAGHGSRPDLAHSTLDCFHEIYNALQTLRLRYVRPNASLTWSIGSIHAGERFNVVPDDLVCQGSVRFLDKDSGMAFWAEFRRVLDSVCPLNYCSYRLPEENLTERRRFLTAFWGIWDKLMNEIHCTMTKLRFSPGFSYAIMNKTP